jgi:MarR family transcriptional regulator for hemolysin
MGQAVELAPAPAEAQQQLSQNLCWLMSQASYTYTTELTAALETLGISPRAQHVLATAMAGEHTQTELARMVGLDKTTMVVTLDELEAAGLAERRPAPGDRRARVIAVTKAGAEKVREGEEIANLVQERVLGALTEERRQIFVEALNSLVTGPLAEPCACTNPPRRRAPRG